MRQPVRNVIGGSPTTSWKRRARDARETPTAEASSADGPRIGRDRSCIIRTTCPTVGSELALNHTGTADQLRCEGSAQRADEQQVQQSVEDHLLAGLLLDDL